MATNADVARRVFAGWAEGDYESADWADPEIDFVIVDGPAPGRWRGLAGMAAGTRDWLSAWVDLRQGVDEVRELDAERVLVLQHYRGRAKRSGFDMPKHWAKGATVLTVRGGKVTRLVTYFDRDRALAELGIAAPPSAASGD